MSSIGAFSQYAFSQIGPVTTIPAALRRIAQARTAETVTFLEITARSNTVTTQTDSLAAFSALPFSALTVARTERVATSYLISSRPWVGRPTDTLRPNQRAIPQLISAGKVSRRVPVDSSVNRRAQRTIGDAQLANADGSLDYLIRDNTLQGGVIKAWVAAPTDDAADWALIFEATIDRVEASRQEIRLGISTIADQLKRPFQLRRYTGGGGLSGDANVSGRPKPVAYGEIFGAEPVLMSTANRIYQLHDGPLQAIEAVYEGGLPYTFTDDYPDFDTLANATLASGEYATCLARGLFRIGTTLAGLVYPLRVTFKGDSSGNGYVSATGDILYRVARDRAFLPAISLDIASFNALPRGRVGFYESGGQELTCEDVFDRLLQPLSASYGVGTSAVVSVRRLLPAAQRLNDLTVREEQLLDIRVDASPYTPRISQPYSYAPTWAPLTVDQVSPLADGSLVARLTTSARTGQVDQSSTAVIPLIAQPTLATLFADQSAAIDAARDALTFSAENYIPARLQLGRSGLLADIGGVVALQTGRYVSEYRGVMYEIEYDLGAAVTSRVVALG